MALEAVEARERVLADREQEVDGRIAAAKGGGQLLHHLVVRTIPIVKQLLELVEDE